MNHAKAFVVSMLGVGAIVTGYALHCHILKAKAARLERVVAPAPYFPAGSVWTQDVSHAPVDPHSSAIIAWLASAGGWGTGKMQIDFEFRVLQADDRTPQAPFREGPAFDAADSDKLSTFPLPAVGGIEGSKDYTCPSEHGDCHLIVVDRGRGKLYEAYEANYAEGTLTANDLAVWNLNRVYPLSGRGDQCSSVDAAGFPVAPLLFNADELATGSIHHAIRFILPNPRMRANFFVHPATHAGAPRGPADAPPMGAHFRLKATYDLSKLTPAAQIVARAMQKYGMFLSDGGQIALTAQSDEDTVAKYADMGLGPHDLAALKVTDFEVLDMGTPIPLTYNCVRNPEY